MLLVREQTNQSVDIRKVAINDLHLDPEFYQREPDAKRVRRIVEDFNPNSVGVLQVSERSDGMLYVIDGWHRVWALMQLGIAEWDAQVHTGLTRQEEALEFVAANNRKALSPYQIFRARLNGGDPITEEIVAIIVKHGFRPHDGKYGNLRATQTLYLIYERWGMQALDRTFDIIARAWPADPYRVGAALIFGLAMFLAVYGTSVDHEDVIRKLAKRLPLELAQDARASVNATGGDMRTAFARVILRQVNKGRRQHTLEDAFTPGRHWASFGMDGDGVGGARA